MVVGLAIALAITVLQLNLGLQQGIVQMTAASPIDDSTSRHWFVFVNQGQQFLGILGNLATLIAAATLFLAVYNTSNNRERLLATMRSLGASRSTIFCVVLFETVLMAFIGALVGRIINYIVTITMLTQISTPLLIPMVMQYQPAVELWFWLMPALLGTAAGLLPALAAYNTNVIEKLFPG
jgi:putative ABC transport system permease protein